MNGVERVSGLTLEQAIKERDTMCPKGRNTTTHHRVNCGAVIDHVQGRINAKNATDAAAKKATEDAVKAASDKAVAEALIQMKAVADAQNAESDRIRKEGVRRENARLEEIENEKNSLANLSRAEAKAFANRTGNPEQPEYERLMKVPALLARVLDADQGGTQRDAKIASISLSDMQVLCPISVDDQTTKSCQPTYVKNVYRTITQSNYDLENSDSWNASNFPLFKDNLTDAQLRKGYCKNKVPFILSHVVNAAAGNVQLQLAGFRTGMGSADVTNLVCPSPNINLASGVNGIAPNIGARNARTEGMQQGGQPNFQNQVLPPKKKNKFLVLKIVGFIFLLLIVFGAMWYFLFKRK